MNIKFYDFCFTSSYSPALFDSTPPSICRLFHEAACNSENLKLNQPLKNFCKSKIYLFASLIALPVHLKLIK